MNRIAIVCVFAILTGSISLPVANAALPATTQPGANGGGPLQKVREALNQLDLSAQQKVEIRKIMSNARTKLEALKTGGQTPDKSEVRPIIKAAIEQMMKVLKPDQKEKLRGLLKEERSTTQPA
jgi:Spy/CpxP family protein refolding chaperone